jgi:hypothetical protein
MTPPRRSSDVLRATLAGACLALAGCGWRAIDLDHPRVDGVTRWAAMADRYGKGDANWRTLAIMHVAMHDALNAARPVYERFSPPSADEPPAEGANPEVAMAAAAREVLMQLHPERAPDTEAAFARVISAFADDASTRRGKALGSAIGRAAVLRRVRDGAEVVRDFQGHEVLGSWRPTPQAFATSRTNESRPFLFADVAQVPFVPPPMIGSPAYEEQLAEAQRMGGLRSSARTSQQTDDANFWAYQSSQRGFVNLAVRLFAAAPAQGGVHAEARVMAQLTVALADSAILTWREKERYSGWRPITAIRAEGTDPDWMPLVETPPFPEYPSGHATDCYVGAGVLRGAFPDLAGPIVYQSSAFMDPASGSEGSSAPISMGQHAQWVDGETPGGRERRFVSLDAAADDCASSRIWAGAHFAAAEVESKRLAGIIVQRALAVAPPVSAIRPASP